MQSNVNIKFTSMCLSFHLKFVLIIYATIFSGSHIRASKFPRWTQEANPGNGTKVGPDAFKVVQCSKERKASKNQSWQLAGRYEKTKVANFGVWGEIGILQR